MNGYGAQQAGFKLERLFSFWGRVRFLLVSGVILTAVLWFTTTSPTAYTATSGNGPGGVGMTDGSSTLELWLRADKGVFADGGCNTAVTDGNSVGCWQDQSGNGVSATQATGAQQPTFNTGVLNNQPVLFFDGADYDNLVSGSISLDHFTIFSVINSTGTNGFVYEQGASTDDYNGNNLYSGTECSAYVKRGETTSGLSFGTSWITSTHAFVVDSYGGSHSSHTASKNDVSISTSCTYGDNDPVNPMSPLDVNNVVYIGARAGVDYPSTVAYPFAGNVAELIFYSEQLPDVQRILVENYLSAKYDIVFGALGTNDHYDGDEFEKGDFDLDVAGIGKFGGVLHNEAHSAGMIVTNAGFLQDNGDWLLFGHNVSINGNTAGGLPSTPTWTNAPYKARWTRSWYIDVTDVPTHTNGLVTVTFDFNEAGMGNFTPANNPNDYRLLKRSASSGDFDLDIATASSVDVTNKRVTFANVSVADLGSNFTLGTLNNNNSPTAVFLEPVTITSQPGGLMVIAACLLTLGVGSVWICVRHRPE